MAWNQKNYHDVVIDVETFAGKPSQEQYDAHLALVKEELVQASAIEARMKKYVEAGALDFERARVISLALYSCKLDLMLSFSSDHEASIANWFVQILDQWDTKAPNIRFVGFNILAFDLPLIHLMLIRANQISPVKVGKWTHVDMIDQPYGRLLGKKPLAWYLKVYGLPQKSGKGSEVHDLWLEDCKNGTKAVEEYNRQDCSLEATLYRKMSEFYNFD